MSTKQRNAGGFPVPPHLKKRYVVMIEQTGNTDEESYATFYKQGLQHGWEQTQAYQESGNDLVVIKETTAADLIADVEALRPYLPQRVVAYLFVEYHSTLYSVWDGMDGRLYSVVEVTGDDPQSPSDDPVLILWDKRKSNASMLVRHLEMEWLRIHPTNPIEPAVRPLVVLLNSLGFQTTGSSEGSPSPDGMRMSDTFVNLWVDCDEPGKMERWSRLMRDMLLEAPTTSMNELCVGRDGRGESLYTISLRYTGHFPHQEKIKRMAISQLVAWLDENGPRYLKANVPS